MNAFFFLCKCATILTTDNNENLALYFYRFVSFAIVVVVIVVGGDGGVIAACKNCAQC